MLAIGAASIVAKVTRDRLMREYDRKWPAYGFAQHKGYPTAQHMAAIRKHGPCAIHRRTFAPLKTMNLAPLPNEVVAVALTAQEAAGKGGAGKKGAAGKASQGGASKQGPLKKATKATKATAANSTARSATPSGALPESGRLLRRSARSLNK